MQSAEDWAGKEYGLPSSRCAIEAHPCPKPSACASHCSSERKISESGADALSKRWLSLETLLDDGPAADKVIRESRLPPDQSEITPDRAADHENPCRSVDPL